MPHYVTLLPLDGTRLADIVREFEVYDERVRLASGEKVSEFEVMVDLGKRGIHPITAFTVDTDNRIIKLRTDPR